MHRRQFIRDVLLWSAGVSLALPRFTIQPTAMAADQPQPLVSVARGADYPALVTQVLEPLGSMAAFVRPGDRVVVKPNIGWDRSPEQGANTHPQVVRAVVEAALAAGATRYWSSTGPATSRGAAMRRAASRRRCRPSATAGR